MKYICSVLRLLFLCGLSFGQFDSAYYVSNSGNDDNPGSLELPFATLARARDAVRSQTLPQSGVTIFLRGGKYFRAIPFELTSEDSGEEGKPIVYCSFPGEEARIIGGRQLSSSWFSLVDASMPAWPRIDAAARGVVLVCDLTAHGISEFGTIRPRGFYIPGRTFMELACNGNMMQLAQWPNSGYDATNGIVDIFTFRYAHDRPSRWTGASDAWIHVYPVNGYGQNYVPISRIDTAAKTITCGSKPGNGLNEGPQGPRPWKALNLLEELDSPGEYYIDRVTGQLFFWPPVDISLCDMVVSTMGEYDEPIIRLSNAANIHLRGLTVEITRYDAIRTVDCNSVVIENCLIRNTGTDGIGVFNGKNHLIHNCTLYGTGQKGIYLTGGDRINLIPSNNEVKNCDIYQFSRWNRSYHPAVWVYGCGSRVVHNTFHDAPHAAVLLGIDSTEGRLHYGATGGPSTWWKLGANNCLIDRNRIFNVGYYSDDAGAIYIGRGWDRGGNIFSNNFIYNIQSRFTAHSIPGTVNGIYLDTAISNQTVTGNILYNIHGRAFWLQGGRQCTFQNNIAARCIGFLGTNCAGVGLIKETTNPAEGNYDLNYLARLLNYNYQTNPAWLLHFPDIAAIPYDYTSPLYLEAKKPQGSSVKGNVGWANTYQLEDNGYNSGGYRAFDYIQLENNLLDTDPLFVDEAALNLELRPESPAYSIPGFQKVPFVEIGFELNPSKPQRMLQSCPELSFTMQIPPWADISVRLGDIDISAAVIKRENGAVMITFPRHFIQERSSLSVTVSDPYSGQTASVTSDSFLCGDLNCDNRVDLNDFMTIASNWLRTQCGDCSGADLTGDNQVTLSDLERLVWSWMESF